MQLTLAKPSGTAKHNNPRCLFWSHMMCWRLREISQTLHQVAKSCCEQAVPQRCNGCTKLHSHRDQALLPNCTEVPSAAVLAQFQPWTKAYLCPKGWTPEQSAPPGAKLTFSAFICNTCPGGMGPPEHTPSLLLNTQEITFGMRNYLQTLESPLVNIFLGFMYSISLHILTTTGSHNFLLFPIEVKFAEKTSSWDN